LKYIQEWCLKYNVIASKFAKSYLLLITVMSHNHSSSVL
jgi:hypothetical protein